MLLLQGMELSPDGWEHIGGFGVIAVLVAREVLRYVDEKREKAKFFVTPQDDDSRLKRVGDMTVETLEAKVRHVVRNELGVLCLKIDESNKRLEQINNSMIRLVAIMEERRNN